MEFGVLGPLLVRSDHGQLLDIPRPKVRLLLTILLVHANSGVSVETLIDSLWGMQPVRSARANLKTYVVALRRALSPGDPSQAPVRTAANGYSIHVAAESLDLLVFQRLAEEAARARQLGDHDAVVERLTSALALWRGSAFEDVAPLPDVLVAAAHRLEEQRLTAVEDLVTARVALGEHSEVIGELHAWTARYPLRERMWEQLMLALYRDGRQAEALAMYKRLRARLIEEVGVEPGPPLRELQKRILNADPALLLPRNRVHGDPPAPHQLPLDVATFVGRRTALDTVREMLDDGDTGRRVPAVVVHGAPGVGKSAFAVRVAGMLTDRFPGGELYVNLHGATPGVSPLSAGESLGRLLRALGVDAGHVPQATDEAAALFRTLVAGRRMLILLDNASSAAQVRPLMPGGSGSGVIVTSRDELSALDGAEHVRLGPLSADEAQEMLSLLLPVASVINGESTRALAELCDRLPLGLHIAAARLRARPDWNVDDLVSRLSDARERLSELRAGDLAVRTSLGVSFSTLRQSENPIDRMAARALCQLSVLEVASVDLYAAAAVIDTPPAKAERVLERLLESHLVDVETGGRFHSHDLVRLFAAERARHTMSHGVLTATVTRGMAYYLATSRHATTLVYPRRTHGPVPDFISPARTFADQDEAERWLEVERANLVAVTRQALRGDDDQAALGVGLTIALHWFFANSGYPRDAVLLAESALPVTRRNGDRVSEAYVRDSLGLALSVRGLMSEARRQFQLEVGLCREAGDRFGEQRALGNLGRSYVLDGLAEQAVPLFEQQFRIARELRFEVGEVFASLSMARAYQELGRLHDAIELLRAAVAWCDATGDDYLGAAALVDLAQISMDAGDAQEAVGLLIGSLERARRSRYRLGEVWALTGLSRAWRLLGSPDRALTCVREASVLVRASGYTRAATAIQEEYTRALEAAGR
ncbi:BTAD domain-containing putative transcriptional regulator [Dactylosporangium fulvum]|uniref:Winged helix-turn-helix domain-containing protein n=1 Tax=Dactylosporangium fulvum TaxID=53359 RepID=A0ABY5W2X8_9ACTN|nr:BTAD domain-containing putative transcriptional regulator [Dactylosporangium fulvum]UWP82421.1 winged helix-turn-helix domain-containing protein [Dactylosporangium fulvum]